MLQARISPDGTEGWGELAYLGQRDDLKVSFLVFAKPYVIDVIVDVLTEIWEPVNQTILETTRRTVAGGEPAATLQIDIQLDVTVESAPSYLFARANKMSRVIDRALGV